MYWQKKFFKLKYTYLTEHKYFKKHFFKSVLTDCFTCATHQETQHLKKAVLVTSNKN